ncbi:MAG: hypothetical protein JSV85_07705 [Candidatus Bathyarchaeota archaeon]|nr:MAG: hypothetical protein JSV85_07705 [Candidatus Bathyarchaeota archaeon]
MFAFISQYRTLREILVDHKLAALGDAYVNLIYSLALSEREGQPVGKKVNSHVLAAALKKAEMRDFLPRRTDRHSQADAAEAVIVYAWVQDLMSMQEGVNLLGQEEDVIDAFCSLLCTVRRRLKL